MDAATTQPQHYLERCQCHEDTRIGVWKEAITRSGADTSTDAHATSMRLRCVSAWQIRGTRSAHRIPPHTGPVRFHREQVLPTWKRYSVLCTDSPTDRDNHGYQMELRM